MERRVSTCAPLPHRASRKSQSDSTIEEILHPDEFCHTVVVMVGLPARGKTYIAKKMARYLNWVGISTKVFNVGEYRRKVTDNYKNHNFFDKDNKDAQVIRKQAAEAALKDLTNWLQIDGEIAVFDATNSTRERREWVLQHCQQKMLQVIFVESLCYDEEIVEESIREVKINSPDYVGMDKNEAVDDFRARIKHYEEYYETLDETLDKDKSFIKIYNQGEKFLVNRIHGNILSRIVYYLMNIRVLHRAIYLTRHGESMLNVHGRIGGDADLSARGRTFARKLADFIESEDIHMLKVWTSHFKRTIQTAQYLKDYVRIEHWKALNEIDAGVCEEMTYEEIQEKYPVDFAKRDEDKYHYRYHMGESYQDLVARLEPVIMELERQSNVLVVCHQAVARCLLAYFLDKNKEDLPYVKVPLHTVIKLTPAAYGCTVEYIDLDVPAVDTHRDKPEGVPSKTLIHARDQRAHREHTNPHHMNMK